MFAVYIVVRTYSRSNNGNMGAIKDTHAVGNPIIVFLKSSTYFGPLLLCVREYHVCLLPLIKISSQLADTFGYSTFCDPSKITYDGVIGPSGVVSEGQAYLYKPKQSIIYDILYKNGIVINFYLETIITIAQLLFICQSTVL